MDIMLKRISGWMILLAICSPLHAQDLENDDALRGAFVKTRKEVPRRVTSAAITARKKDTGKAGKSTNSSAPRNPVITLVGDASERPLALGYTVYKKGLRGLPHRIAPATIFRKGEALRFTVEPNSDGYFYIFTRENEGQPKLLFPSSRLVSGENFLHAHHLYEVPSRQEQDPDDRWFVFDEKPAQEHFYFVLSRDRITEIPSGAALQKFDEQAAGKEWTPPEILWEALLAKMSIPLLTDQRVEVRSGMHRDEVASITRGVGLKPKSPAPTVLKQQKKAEGNWLVIQVTVTHQ